MGGDNYLEPPPCRSVVKEVVSAAAVSPLAALPRYLFGIEPSLRHSCGGRNPGSSEHPGPRLSLGVTTLRAERLVKSPTLPSCPPVNGGKLSLSVYGEGGEGSFDAIPHSGNPAIRAGRHRHLIQTHGKSTRARARGPIPQLMYHPPFTLIVCPVT